MGRRAGRSNGPFGRTKQPGFKSDCWRALCQTGVRSRGVVMVEPRRQCSTAFLGTGIGLGVGPFAQTGLDEPLRLAVGAGGVGSGALVSGAGRCHRRPERFASVGGAVIGHDPLDADALTAEPRQRAAEKPDRALLFLVRQDLAVSQARGVVDTNVQCLPADAVMAIDRTRLASGNAVADTGDAPELLGVEVDQLARTLALVAHDRRLLIKRRQPIQTQPAQNPANRGHRHAELASDLWPAHPLPPQPLDFAHSVASSTVLAVVRRRAAITQTCRSLGAITRQPAIALPYRDPRGLRRLHDAPARLCNALDQQEATLRRQPRSCDGLIENGRRGPCRATILWLVFRTTTQWLRCCMMTSRCEASVAQTSFRPRQFAAEGAEPATWDEESAFSAYVLTRPSRNQTG